MFRCSGTWVKPGDKVWTTIYRLMSPNDPQSIYAERICGVVTERGHGYFEATNKLMHLDQCGITERVINLDDRQFPVLPGPMAEQPGQP